MSAIFTVESPDPDSDNPILRDAARYAKLGAGSYIGQEAKDEDLIYVRIHGKVLIDRRTKEQKEKDGY